MKIKEGRVEPGVGIGKFKINMKKEELLKIIGRWYKTDLEGKLIIIKNAMFWLDDENRIEQILVSKGFKGKFREFIGIGSTLSDVKKHIGNYYDEDGVYLLYDYEGIGFELGEEGDDYSWDELKAPIEHICVYKE